MTHVWNGPCLIPRVLDRSSPLRGNLCRAQSHPSPIRERRAGARALADLKGWTVPRGGDGEEGAVRVTVPAVLMRGLARTT